MDNQEFGDLIESSHFIDDDFKDQCKQYFRQIPKDIDKWFYSSTTPKTPYQGDIVDNFETVYCEVIGDRLETQSLEGIPYMLLSNTCDLEPKGKTRGNFISVAP